MSVIAASAKEREAFETAVAMARAMVIDRTPPADIATYWGISEPRMAADVIQNLGMALFDVAKATGAWADLGAMVDGLQPDDDD